MHLDPLRLIEFEQLQLGGRKGGLIEQGVTDVL
jgi:hypothetical protein